MSDRLLELIFPDGSMVSGKTYAELEDALRASQSTTYKSRRAFRREMRKRALIWSGVGFAKPVLYQTPKSFIYHLVQSGMCFLHEPVPTPTTTAGQE